MRRRLVNARLLTLLIKLRVSAELTYRRQLGLSELNRRLVSLIGNYGGLSSVELVGLSGQEKAQISRAVKALAAAGLIERTGLRAKIRLSTAGQGAFDEMMAIAVVRNDALTAGVDLADLAAFRAMTVRLIDRAALLLASERQLSGPAADLVDNDDPGEMREPTGLPSYARPSDAGRPLSPMVSPPLVTLVAYLQRSATIAYRRETDLSNFGWQVLSQIGEHAPITLARLIAMTARDKSQVGRTVRRLEEAGAVARQSSRGRDILLTPTAAGARTYERMCVDALRRDDFLFADWTAEERGLYLALLDVMTDNAEAQLEAERERAAAAS